MAVAGLWLGTWVCPSPPCCRARPVRPSWPVFERVKVTSSIGRHRSTKNQNLAAEDGGIVDHLRCERAMDCAEQASGWTWSRAHSPRRLDRGGGGHGHHRDDHRPPHPRTQPADPPGRGGSKTRPYFPVGDRCVRTPPECPPGSGIGRRDGPGFQGWWIWSSVSPTRSVAAMRMLSHSPGFPSDRQWGHRVGAFSLIDRMREEPR